MHRSRALVSLFLLTMLILTACQSGSTPTPEIVASLLPTDSPPPTDTPPPTATPTLTPTATPTQFVIEPGQCVQLIENGDFETGTLEPWILHSNLGKQGVANFRPGSGKYSVVLGDGLNADERLEIELTIPASTATATLSFWADYVTQETDGQSHDVLNVSLQTPDGEITGLLRLDNATRMDSPQHIFDVSEYAGKSLRIFFHAQTDAQNRSDFSIDDITLEACGPAPEVAAATETPALPISSPTAIALGKGECIELIENGDFETGVATPWIESGNLNWPLVTEFPGRSHDKFSAFMGSTSNVNQSLSQLITIPTSAASATLTYWWNRASHEKDGTPHDFLTVSLRGPDDKDLATLEEINNTTGQNFEFYQSTKDLSPYIGKAVSLVFHVTTDAQNDSDFSVDDVSLQACGPK